MDAADHPRALLDGPRRFVDLQNGIAQVGNAQLQTRLASMEADGLVTRQRFREQPPRVVFELMPDGYAAAGVLEALAEWERSR